MTRHLRASIYVLDIQDTVCLGHTLGEIRHGEANPRDPLTTRFSAEVIARMLAAKLNGSNEWELPSWLPRHYLTSAQPGDGLRAA